MYSFPGLWREGGEMFVKPITKQKPALVNIFLLSMSFTCAGSCRRFNNEWWTNEPKFGYSRLQWSVHLWCGVKLPCLPPSKDNGGKALSVYLSLRGTVLHAKELIKVPDQSWDHCRTCSTKLYVQFCKHLEVWFRLKLNSKQPCCLIGSQECIRTGN